MEDNRSDLVVIAAGYTDEMKNLSNQIQVLFQGLISLLIFRIIPDDELIRILQLMAKAGYILDPDAVFAVNYYVGNMSRQGKEEFWQCKRHKKHFEHMVSAQADRITGGTDIDVNRADIYQ